VEAMDDRLKLRSLVVLKSGSGTRAVDQEFKYRVIGVSVDVVKQVTCLFCSVKMKLFQCIEVWALLLYVTISNEFSKLP
jgi:hypothetical protein